MPKHELVISVDGKRVVIGEMDYMPFDDITHPRDARFTIPVFVDAKIDDIPVDVSDFKVTIKRR